MLSACLVHDDVSQKRGGKRFRKLVRHQSLPPSSDKLHRAGEFHLTCIIFDVTQFQQIRAMSSWYLQAPPTYSILHHGYIAHMFTIFTEHFFQCVLKSPLQSVNVQFSVEGLPNTFAVAQGEVINISGNFPNLYGQPYLLLDFLADTSRGPIVPQTLWIPRSVRDQSHYVLEAELQLPIFFIRNDGGIGISLTDASSGSSSSLLGNTQPVNVGGRTSVHLRIQVRKSFYLQKQC
jgi:hypothetical protein